MNRRRELIKCMLISMGALPLIGLENSTLFAGASKSPWKWSKRALYFKKDSKTNRVFCELCPNECIIQSGNPGDCRTRVNYDGTLHTIAYGNPCSVNVDPIEKKPLFHFLPSSRTFSLATAGCNLKCLNCQNWTISQASPEETRNYELFPEQVVQAAQKYKCQTISYTYSEPIVFYEYMLDSAILAHEKNIKNIMVTAGFIKEAPLRRLCKYIDAVNIDLKSYDDEIYKKLNAGRLQPVLDTLRIMKEEKVWIEITNLVVPTWNDKPEMFRNMCRWLYRNGFADAPLHFSRFTPLYKLTNLPPTPVSTLETAREIALQEGIRYVYIGNVPGASGEDTICPSCKKLIINRRGFFVQKNNLNAGKCRFCGQTIAGVWQ